MPSPRENDLELGTRNLKGQTRGSRMKEGVKRGRVDEREKELTRRMRQ